MLQALPFHRTSIEFGMPWLVEPTAQAVFAAVTATPARMLSDWLAGFSLMLARDHALPFQCRRSGATTVWPRLTPTAQALVAVAVTPYNAPPMAGTPVAWLQAFAVPVQDQRTAKTAADGADRPGVIGRDDRDRGQRAGRTVEDLRAGHARP